MKLKYFIITLFSLSLAGFSGCTTGVNMTPVQRPQNPTNVYTFSCKAEAWTANIVDDSWRVYLVIGGEKHLMNRVGNTRIFELDYQVPEKVVSASYYYEFNYMVNNGKTLNPQVKTSDLQELNITNRFVNMIDPDRAPIGARVALTGRGFSKTDVILIGGVPADTKFYSTNSISFIVPALAAGTKYPLQIQSENGNMDIGTFLVDPARITTSPDAISLSKGEVTTLSIRIPFRAPSGGLLFNVSVSNSLARSVRMSECFIKEGEDTTSIRIKGEDVGQGTIYLKASGYQEVRVPIAVNGNGAIESISVNDTVAPLQ